MAIDGGARVLGPPAQIGRASDALAVLDDQEIESTAVLAVHFAGWLPCCSPRPIRRGLTRSCW